MLKMKVLLLLFSVTCHVALASYTNGGLVPNGNFEEPPTPSCLDGTKLTCPDAIPHWKTSGTVEYIKSGQKQGDMLLVVPEGSYAVRLGNDDAIKQTITDLTPGMTYSITFSAARTCAQQEKVKVAVSPNSEASDSGEFPIQTMYSSNGWDMYSWAFVAESSEVDISILNPVVDKEDGACGPLIDSIALKALPPVRRTEGNLIRNGNFESGPYIMPNASSGVLVPSNLQDDHCPLIGWMVTSLKAVKYVDFDHFFVPVGNRAVELIAGRESIIAQMVRTTPGRVYDLTFAIGDASNSCEGTMVVEAFAGKESFKVPYESSGNGGFKRAKLRFTATSPLTRVRFLSSYYAMKSDHSGSLCGPVVDDVKLVAVNTPMHKPQHKHA